jgi:hypothetical protein
LLMSTQTVPAHPVADEHPDGPGSESHTERKRNQRDFDVVDHDHARELVRAHERLGVAEILAAGRVTRDEILDHSADLRRGQFVGPGGLAGGQTRRDQSRQQKQRGRRGGVDQRGAKGARHRREEEYPGAKTALATTTVNEPGGATDQVVEVTEQGGLVVARTRSRQVRSGPAIQPGQFVQFIRREAAQTPSVGVPDQGRQSLPALRTLSHKWSHAHRASFTAGESWPKTEIMSV